MHKRRLFNTLAVFGLACLSGGAMAQARFPSQPVKLIVPYPAGGGTDFFARTVAQGMGDALGGVSSFSVQ